jgi:uncharacterized membrane protein YdjX (TVP38/TMEM64 family)
MAQALSETPVAPASLLQRALTSPGLWALVATLAVGGVAWAWIDGHGGLAEARATFGIGAAFVTVPLQAIIAVTPFPDEVIGFGNSIAYGFVTGGVLNWIGWMLGAFIEYAIAYRSARDLNLRVARFVSEGPRWLRALPPEHPAFLILTRLLPLGGGHIVNTTAGVCGVSLWRFAWTGAIGMIPGSLAISGLANGLLSWTL